MNEDNLDYVERAHGVINGYLLSKGTIKKPGKTALVKLDELKDCWVPVNHHVEPVRCRSGILKVNHVSRKASTDRGRNRAEGLILVRYQRLVSAITNTSAYRC